MQLYNEPAVMFDGGDEDEVTIITMEEYDQGKAECHEMIRVADAVRRLNNHPDWIEIIQEGYFKAEPARLGNALASGRFPESSIASIHKDFDAIGRFRNYLRQFIQQGELADEQLKALEEAREYAISVEEAASV